VRNCAKCKAKARPWELLCPLCAPNSPTESDHIVLLGSTSSRVLTARLLATTILIVGGFLSVRATLFFLAARLAPRWGEWINSAAVLAIVIVFLFTFAALWAAWQEFAHHTASYEVTSTEAVTHFQRSRNVLPSDTGAIALRDVTSVDMEQSAVGRWLDYGDIRIFSAGNTESYLRLVGVAHPKQFVARLNTLVANAGTFPRPPHRTLQTPLKEPEHESFGDRVKAILGALLFLLMVVAMIYGACSGSKVRNPIMRVGETREVHLTGQGLIALSNEKYDCSWSEKETEETRFRVTSPGYIQVAIESFNVTATQMSSGCMFGLDTTVRITVLSDAPAGQPTVKIMFFHPKLLPPHVTAAGVETMNVTVSR
jgi:hypothetical protein